MINPPQERLQVICKLQYHPDSIKAIPAISDVDIFGGMGKIKVRKGETIKAGELVLISRNFTNFLIKPPLNQQNDINMPYLYGVPKMVSNDINDI